MIKAHAIRGNRDEIARELEKAGDRLLEAILFVEEKEPEPAADGPGMFDEMDSHTVSVPEVDYSRESIYARPEMA